MPATRDNSAAANGGIQIGTVATTHVGTHVEKNRTWQQETPPCDEQRVRPGPPRSEVLMMSTQATCGTRSSRTGAEKGDGLSQP